MISPETPRLHVLVAGAGIGGLSAAIALRQAGHVVEIFESSRFAVELGAAIHLPPNVNGLLRRFGINPEDFNCNDAEFVTVYDSQGNLISSKDVRNLRDLYPFPWQLAHRIDLHEALKAKATSIQGLGVPVKIHLRGKVVDCDPEKPSLTLADGTVVHGDLLIGADGVHSVLRKVIAKEDIAAEPSGGSAFRFLVPVSKINENPETAALIKKPGELQFWDGQYRRLVIYPCRNNTELNFVCLHPDTESDGGTEGWNISGSQENLLRVFGEFSPAMRSLLAMADPEGIKLWRLLDRKALGTWINGSSCLIGDAAHPFLPHQGQGGAQAIEDGIALGALLPLGTTREEIPERLKLYMTCRYNRATLVQNFSRQAAFKISAKDTVGGTSTDPLEFMRINFGHDAYDYASNVLRKHLGTLSSSPTPLTTIFGPPASLLGTFSRVYDLFGNPSQRLLEVKFRARRNHLETFLPKYDSRIVSPGGWATASWVVRRIKATEWQGTSDATVLGLCISDAISQGQDEPALFTPLLFSDNADFVLAARGELNAPILLAGMKQSLLNGSYSIDVEHSGRQFMSLSASSLPTGANGHSNETQGSLAFTVTDLTTAVMDVVFLGMTHIIQQLQGLYFKDPQLVQFNV